MKGNLYLQKPKPSKKQLVGEVTSDKAEMFFWDDANNPQGHVLAKLEKPEIIFINSRGMMVKGYEPDGVDRAGRRKFKYQEWFVAFLDSKK